MILTYSGRSRPSAQAICDESEGEIELNRGSEGDVNWGRNVANTELNPDISNSTNKRVMRELFMEHDVPMPELYDLHEVRVGIDLGQKFVGRPDRHSKGRGFWLIDSHRALERALRGTRRKRAATHFMDFVEAEREYRVHIFKGKSIRISQKEFYRDENGSKQYRTIKPTGELRNIRNAAKQAIGAVGLDFGAVDVLANGSDNEQVWVLEVNAAPGLGGTMPELYANTFLRWRRGEW